MMQPKTYAGIICVLLILKLGSWAREDFVAFTADNGYMTECIMHDPPTPVEYESYFRDYAIYTVTYEGHTRWNGEKCKERERVNVTEYRRAKAIVEGKIK